ncbi:MAG: hypothetical protein J6T10_25420 [Methanobrevibacter sp.]|nr:hypothetical protein [Methanobrevibacter sp.]
MTEKEKRSLKIRLGQRLSYDKSRVMEIVKEEIDKTETTMERPHGEWIENTRYKRKGKKFLDCSRCHYGENGDIICEVSKLPNFCPNCGASMSANDRQVTGKLKEGEAE